MFNADFAVKSSIFKVILLIIEGCRDKVILSIKIKSNILQKTLFQRFSPKFIKISHGHIFFDL